MLNQAQNTPDIRPTMSVQERSEIKIEHIKRNPHLAFHKYITDSEKHRMFQFKYERIRKNLFGDSWVFTTRDNEQLTEKVLTLMATENEI